MAQLTLLIMSAILILLVVAHGRAKNAGFDILDAHFLMVMLFFGVYSVIDAVLNDQTGKDSTLVVLTFALIIFAMLVNFGLYLLFPLKLRRLLLFSNLIEYWANVDRKIIAFLASVFFAYNGYLFIEYGMITYVGTELDILKISLPSWIGPVKVLINSLGFCCYVSIVASIVKRRTRIFSFFGLLMLALTAALSLEGRRAFVELMLVAFILWSCSRRENFYSFKHLLHGIIIFVVFILFSNIYQTYRMEVIPIGRFIKDGEVTSLSSATLNMNATIDNYSKRFATWNFNYIIIAEQVSNPQKIFAGALSLQSLLNSVPRVIWNSKVVIDMDEMVARFYRFEVTDYASNDFAGFQSDFGIFMIVFLPIVNIIVLFLASCYCLVAPKVSVLCLIVPVFCLEYLIKIEKAYGSFFTLFINIILLTVLWLIAVIMQYIIKVIMTPYRVDEIKKYS